MLNHDNDLSPRVEQEMGIDVDDELELPEDAEEDEQYAGHQGQVVTVGCWLTLKEVAMVIGMLARSVPFP
eukprot:scaffold671857_cov67-Prasinocladus_malaysianus.AAC.1